MGLLQEGSIVVYPWSISVGFEACMLGLLQDGSIVVYPWSILLVGFAACMLGLLQEGSIVVYPWSILVGFEVHLDGLLWGCYRGSECYGPSWW